MSLYEEKPNMVPVLGLAILTVCEWTFSEGVLMNVKNAEGGLWRGYRRK